jgi:hypothetical protein
MPWASRAINLAMRWRFTYPFRSHTRAETPSKDTPVYSLRLDGRTILAGLARYAMSRTVATPSGSRRTRNTRSSVVPTCVDPHPLDAGR